MDEAAVRAQAQGLADALVAGDIDRAISTFSNELKRNLGEVIALLPLPATEASIESIELSGSGYNVVIRLVGETDEVQVQARWKDRDGVPTVIEISHLSRTARATVAGDAGVDIEGQGEAS